MAESAGRCNGLMPHFEMAGPGGGGGMRPGAPGGEARAVAIVVEKRGAAHVVAP